MPEKTTSKLDNILARTGKIFLLITLIFIIVPMLLVGYQLLQEVLYPKEDKTSVATRNEETGEKEFLSLEQFTKIKGSQLLVASLEAKPKFTTKSKDYFGHTRNYLFFDTDSRESQWLFQNNSAMFLKDYRLLKDPKANAIEHVCSSCRDTFKDKDTDIISLLYEAVISDSNHDGALSEEDKRSLLYFNLSEKKTHTLLDNIDVILGLEQTTAEEALIFFTNERKNYVLSLNPKTGTGQKSELASIEAKE